MPNDWSDSKLKILRADTIPVEGYGLLYIFDCVQDNRKFNFMSQIFVQRKLNGSPWDIFNYFQKMKGRVGIKPITALNRKIDKKKKTFIRDEEIVIKEAKQYSDLITRKKPEEPPKEQPKEQPKEPQEKEPKKITDKKKKEVQLDLFNQSDEDKHDWYEKWKQKLKEKRGLDEE